MTERRVQVIAAPPAVVAATAVTDEETAQQWPLANGLAEFLETNSQDRSIQDVPLWQAMARKALLTKFGLLSTDETTLPSALSEREKFVQTIQELWESAVASSKAPYTNDLLEFLGTGKSNHRPLQWNLMVCAPGVQFQLHLHPNLELVYCVRGSLHEVRMDGEPIRSWTNGEQYTTTTTNASTKLTGPNLQTVQRPWTFGTLAQGEWLVNEVGSVHKSFTSTAGNGCTLLVLWGGSHADIPAGQEPISPQVHAAVNQMDEKIGCACGGGGEQWESIRETFLPQSERQK